MKKENNIIMILVILIIVAISTDILLLIYGKLNNKLEKKMNYTLCTKEEDIGTTKEEVNIDGKVLKNVSVFDYHRNSKIEIHYNKENNIYSITENEIDTFKNRSYYEANKEYYDTNKTDYTVLDDEKMILSFSDQYEKKSDEINDFINTLQEDEWTCQ